MVLIIFKSSILRLADLQSLCLLAFITYKVILNKLKKKIPYVKAYLKNSKELTVYS